MSTIPPGFRNADEGKAFCISAYLGLLSLISQNPSRPQALPFSLLKLLWQILPQVRENVVLDA